MPTARFYIRNPNAAGECQIFLNFFLSPTKPKYFIYYIHERVPAKFWNKVKQRAKETKQFPQHSELNAYLKNLEDEAQNIYRRYLNKGKKPSFSQFKKELDKFSLRDITAGETSLFCFIQQFIKERESLPKFTANTIKTYRTTLNHLEAFAKKRRRSLEFEDIDLDFFADFQKFLFSPPISLNQNSASKNIAILKTFLHEATERGINKNTAYQSRRFSIPRVEAQNIYLTTDELTTLYHLNLSNNKRLEKVRDLFLIGAFTGLRFSDFTNIKPENIRTFDGVEVIQITTQKTGESVTIPISPIVRAILDKYNGLPPEPISNQKMNKYLKELAELAGFTESVSVSTSTGGIKDSEAFRKCDLVATHTARRSFATNAYKAGIPSISIMKITGHRTEKAFMKYIKISKEENAVLIAMNPFFKMSPMKVVK